MKILVSDCTFGIIDKTPINLLKEYNVVYNETNRKYTLGELDVVLKENQPDIIIAGTEKYNSERLDICRNLKMISRLGIGIDSVDLNECLKRNIIVTNTPDAPSNAAAELTIGQMFNMLRHIQYVSQDIRQGKWNRYIGREIKYCNIGIIGFGRIGSMVAKKLSGLDIPKNNLFINDIIEDLMNTQEIGMPSSKEYIWKNSDIITIHIPLNEKNRNFITKKEFSLMKTNALLINAARGGIINESDLYDWLSKNKNVAAAIDTFENEPYQEKLLSLDNVYLTPHIGSCTEKSRFEMEVGAVKEALNFINKREFNNRVI